MGGLQYAGLIIPVLLLLVAMEYGISRLKKMEVYRFSDTIVNMSCGILERLFDLFFIVFLHYLFRVLFEYVAFWEIPFETLEIIGKVGVWLVALLVGDFLAYWHHRLSHEINVFWAAHIVHHQSEELNMTTVFRVSAFAVINRTFFWIWLPILGFNPVVSTSVIVFIGLFQFLTHTRLIGKLGILEYFLVTPSHHRVHHARNERYIDKNYGHVFIIWDKMLGTFEPEVEEPEYGIISGFESSNPYWAYFSYWTSLFKRAAMAKQWKNKLKLFIAPPAWENKDVPIQKSTIKTDEYGNRKKYRLNVPDKLSFYTLINILITVALFVYLIVNHEHQASLTSFLLTFLIIFSIISFGPLMERKKWGFFIDYIRLFLLAFSIPFLFNILPNKGIVIGFSIIIILAQIVWLTSLRNYFILSKDVENT